MLFAKMVGAVGHQFRFLTGKGRFVEHLSFAARDEPGETVDAGDQATAITRNTETRVRPELGGHAVGWHLCGAFESNNGCKKEVPLKFGP